MTSNQDQIVRVLPLALLSLLLSAVVLLVVAAVLFRGDAGAADASEASPFNAADLSVIVGRGSARDGQLTLSAFARDGAGHHAVAVWRGAFSAEEFPYLLIASDVPAGRQVNFTWRQAGTPGEIRSLALSPASAGTTVVDLSADPAWTGPVIEAGLYTVGDSGNSPLTVAEFSVAAASNELRLSHLLSQWLAPRVWDQTSINYLRAVPEGQLSPVPVAAAWAVIALLLYFLFTRRLGLAALGIIVLTPWIAVDVLWQVGLDKQLEKTRETFAGKNAQEKHLADMDAPIYRYAMRLQEELLPQDPARIFIVQNSADHHYLRLKMQYYLLPHNAYNFGDGPPGRFFRAGDYVLVLTNVGDPAFRARSGKLLWRSGKWVPAELLDSDPLGELYRVSNQQVSGG